jgi:hypothetical protein
MMINIHLLRIFLHIAATLFATACSQPMNHTLEITDYYWEPGSNITAAYPLSSPRLDDARFERMVIVPYVTHTGHGVRRFDIVAYAVSLPLRPVFICNARLGMLKYDANDRFDFLLHQGKNLFRGIYRAAPSVTDDELLRQEINGKLPVEFTVRCGEQEKTFNFELSKRVRTYNKP